MRPILSLIVSFALSFLVAPGFGAGGGDLSPADREAIQQVIAKQLDAFQRDDDIEAFSYAAPSIQAQFKTPAEFMRMVRSGYEAVYRPRSTHFLQAFVIDTQVVQPVEVVAPDATLLVAYYLMERQPDGVWRISGCVLGGVQGHDA